MPLRTRLFQINELAKASIISKNRQGLAGLFWWCLEPISITLIYTFLVRGIFQYTKENVMLNIAAVILQWRWFQQSILQGSRTITSHKSLMNQVVLPYQILPISEVFAFFRIFLPEFVLLCIAFIYHNHGVLWHLHELLLLLVVQFFLSIATVSLLAWIHAFFNEFMEIIRIGMRFMFYATPIIYSHHAIPQQFAWVWNLNPLTYLFTAYRQILLNSQSIDLQPILLILAFSLTVILIMNQVYNHTSAALSRIR